MRTQKHINVLIIDDSSADVELIRLEMESAGFEVGCSRVVEGSELAEKLDRGGFDCIICDHKMPGLTSLDVLREVKRRGIDAPFLIVSGVIGEETAVEAMRAGAHDYIMKNNLLRLTPAIERELREAELRREARRSLERLRESEHRFRSMAEAAPILIWMCDREFRCTYLNRRWQEFAGRVFTHAVHMYEWDDLVHPDDKDRVVAVLESSFVERHGYKVEYRLRRYDGEWRTVLDSAVPRDNGMGHVEGYIGSVVDMTDQIHARQEAEQANRAKSRFLANMSHEIRTPLGAILGFADLLRDEAMSGDERSHYLDIIMRNGSELLRIIGDILDLSKIEAGKLAVEIGFFRLRELVDEVVSLFELKAREKGLRLHADVGADVPEWVESDRMRLRQVLINIIGNAVKFTSRGDVSITVEPAMSRDRRSMVKFTIDDMGPGISEESRERLFQAFSQVDASTTREYGGTGLGLVLSRHMARALEGDVTLEENPRKVGSRFVVTIAARHGQHGIAESATAREGLPSGPGHAKGALPLSGYRVLLVEDLKDNQILLRNWLERNGARVETAENGREAMWKALSGAYEVVLMDIHMPVLDGYEATQKLRCEGYRTPIIAITAHAMKDERERLLAAGFDRYLTKPVNLGELLETVRDVTIHA